MSLLSKQNHDLAIKAIEFYMNSLNSEKDAEELVRCHALLNWIKIQESKV